MNPSEPKPTLAVITNSLQFVLPYIKRELPEWDVLLYDESHGDADAFVALQSLEESLPDNLPENCTVLVCAHTVGTGMTGLPMELAKAVASGRYFHVAGCVANVSVIHATDVARAVALSLKDGGRYFISDGADPTFNEFADALAYRLNDKRILTLKPWQAKWLMPKSLRLMTGTDSTVDCSVFPSKFDFKPTAVTEYLRNHVYDESSL